ncbi:MAG: hypothetical protein K2M72_05090 [Paramuribaculum sp.]|nr:hypothetical protein [Paramuribaculum sp.]
MIISTSDINQNNPEYLRQQKFSTEHSEAKLERDPEKEHRFILKIDGISVF